MGKYKLLKKFALFAAILFVLSILVVWIQVPYNEKRFSTHYEYLQSHIIRLTNECQQYLSETAKKITQFPVAPELLREIQSKFLLENQDHKLYLWVADMEGNFVTGVPSTAFTRLNIIYDQHKELLESDRHFINRNDFLLKLVDQYERINYAAFETQIPFSDDEYKWEIGLRYPDYYTYTYTQPFRHSLSSLILSNTGEAIGELFLKIDDSPHRELYFTERQINRNDPYNKVVPLFRVLAVLSGLFLWFLLPAWVYIDARQRDIKNPGLWAFLSFISLFFGLIIYLLTRPETLKSFYCPQCENELNGTKAFCPHCGFDLANVFCPQCQYPIKSNWQFCPNCRAELGQKEKVKDKKTGEADKVDNSNKK